MAATKKATTKKKSVPKVKVETNVVVSLTCKKSETGYSSNQTGARLEFEKDGKNVTVVPIDTAYGGSERLCTQFHIPIADLKKVLEEVDKEYKLA